MARSRSYTFAAALMALYSLISLPLTLPDLMRGPVDGPNAPPFAILLVEFGLAILGFVSAYGVWRVEKWGVVLMIIVAALGVLSSAPGVLFAPELPLRLLSALGIVWSLAIIALLLRSEPKPATL